MSKYLLFELLEKKPKTSVWLVRSKTQNSILGRIAWFASWRQYTFDPTPHTTFNCTCMQDICAFIDKQMDARKL